METLKFKTNIKCSGCLAKVSPYLDKSAGEGKWQVDINDADKTLTVQTDTSSNKIVESVEAAGFKIEKHQG
jgi:copper chaperone